MNQILAFSFLLISVSVFAQLTVKDEKSIDSLFLEWSQNTGPGVAAGLIYGDNIHYTKGFGLAEVQNQTKITPQTKFQIDYLSRQFTVLAILLLEQQGKLSLSDLVQKYFPELPDYEHKLQITHLLNHSSGLYDYGTVKELLGDTEDAIFTHQDALRLISSQKELSFKPGTSFSYLISKTELSLLAEVIAKAANQSLSEFTREHVFEPLQMHDTQFLEDYNTILSNLGHSYQTLDGELKLKAINQGNAGPTNVYTTVNDLFKWYKIFNSPASSVLSTLIHKLDGYVQLEDGTTYDSSWGRMTLGRSFFHKERGLPAYWQYGISGGYAANVFRFPEQRLISFVIGNNDRYNGMPAMLMANHFIESMYPEPSTVSMSERRLTKVSNSELKKYEGYYWNAKRAIARRLFISNDTLKYARLGQEEGLNMIPLKTAKKFQLQVESDDKIFFSFKEVAGQNGYEITSGDSAPNTYVEYQPITYASEVLKEYTGSFYVPTLGIVYEFEIQDGVLVGKGPKGIRITFDPVIKDIFRNQRIAFASIRYQRNASGAIHGFSIYTDGIQNLFFKKIMN